MSSPRTSKWRRLEIMKLMQMAGWSIRQGSKGHVLLQKGEETITLGGDPVHKNSIAEVQRALGIHIEKVIKPNRGRATSTKQILQRIELAKQMKIVGFGSVLINKQCAIATLYRHGFKVSMLDEEDLQPIAESIHASMMAKRGVKVTAAPRDDPTPKTKTPTATDDLGALLELMAALSSKVDDMNVNESHMAGAYRERLQAARSETLQLERTFGRVGESLTRLLDILSGSASYSNG